MMIPSDNSPLCTCYRCNVDKVENAAPAAYPSNNLVLTGKHCTVTAVDGLAGSLDALMDDLWLFCGVDFPEARLMNWPFKTTGPFKTKEEMKADFVPLMSRTYAGAPATVHIADRFQFYAVRTRTPAGGPSPVVGVGCLFRADATNRSIEIGHLSLAPALQGTLASTEFFALVFAHVFAPQSTGGLGYRRLEWKTNSHNTASRVAATKFGFQFEGVFRQILIIKKKCPETGVVTPLNRDTAWYSMIKSDYDKFIAAAYENHIARRAAYEEQQTKAVSSSALPQHVQLRSILLAELRSVQPTVDVEKMEIEAREEIRVYEAYDRLEMAGALRAARK